MWWLLLLQLATGAREEALPARPLLGPKPLVFWHSDELHFQVPHDWTLHGPVGTVCVSGDDRVGKSTLLSLWIKNLTQNKAFEFPAGHARTSFTQGLWSAVLHSEETQLDFHLNLCDSQGLKQVPELQQWRLFAANVLVPQVLVYMLINVVQVDQLRDLARMAHQFQKLGNNSQQHQRFGRLSPHLMVLVREESDLAEQDGRNLTDHLEQVLNSPGYEEDKALIRQVFRTREAWSLEELPKEARHALREGDFTAESARSWRWSGEAALKQVLLAIQRRTLLLPQGPELWEWYRSVLATVNSEEETSLERLIGHGERLDVMRRRRRWLQDCFGRVLATLAGVAILSAFSSSLGLCLDRAAGLAWVLLSVCYLGASPLLKMPMRGLAERVCDQLYLKGGEELVKAICLEASSQSAAVLVASVLGLLSYPLFTAQLRSLLKRIPLPSQLHRSFVTLFLVLLALLLSMLQEVLSEAATSTPAFLGAFAVVFLATLLDGITLLQKVLHNRSCTTASAVGRGLHFWIAQRDAEVAALEASADWKLHFRRYSECDTLWRYRRLPLWQSWSRVLQALGLLTWSWLIYPHWDVVFMLGAGVPWCLCQCAGAAWKASLARICFLNAAAPIDPVALVDRKDALAICNAC
ncbi:Hypothetical protein (Fragment) [Durusdinium trenchii]|uniref:Guanylate-binding protein N-terminal domain-containing protein n=1 Tax=Durusdinium trenchii TaxID=1381693 RepID=A0ABP0STA1_9DINO